ncbi:MAG: excinuclease ABC subunit UvrC [Acidobacteria bacterium]|nr:excinuclease ABC subunit UvrC [Acidobacteriota bacterium]
MSDEGKLADKVRGAPASPGCYLYRDAAGTVVYVGKAKNLRNRVRTYFQDSRPADPKTARLVAEIRDVEYIVTASEYEAFLLESNLVRAHRPRFNLQLRDDKSFPYLRLTLPEPFPRLTLVRRPRPDGSRLFGPFLSAWRARSLLDVVRRCFGVRTCRKTIDGRADRPCCIDYHIHRCLAPCVERLCTADRYRRSVEEAVLFLEGKDEELTGRLESEMHRAADALEFETAAVLRDRLSALRELSLQQRVVSTGSGDLDVFGLARAGECASVQVFHVKGGKVCDRGQYTWEDEPPSPDGAFLAEFLARFYARRDTVPPRILLPVEADDPEGLVEWLTRQREAPVSLRVPKRGADRRLVDLALRNARQALFLRFPSAGSPDDGVTALQGILGLARPPRVVEAFDVSTLQGRETVASLVSARDGKPFRSGYRRFRVRASDGSAPDDFAAMREVVGRRYARLREEGKPLPDLVLVDGGAGQVSAAAEALAGLGLAGVLPLCGLAKREEEIHRPGGAEPLRLPRSSPALRLLQRLRDEAHRFAVAYHRKRRKKAAFVSPLDAVPGLGPSRKQRLVKAFGSTDAVLAAGADALARELGPRLGPAVHRALHLEDPGTSTTNNTNSH